MLKAMERLSWSSTWELGILSISVLPSNGQRLRGDCPALAGKCSFAFEFMEIKGKKQCIGNLLRLSETGKNQEAEPLVH